jgi:acyl-CoA synthetase (AMP-forming)/AMP-acid ligase II
VGPIRPLLLPSPAAMPERVPSDRHTTVVSLLREAARVNGDVEAYVEAAAGGRRRSLTFAEWDRAADGVAGGLARRGVAKGDVVCLLLPSSIDYAVLYAGLLRLGAIASGINPRMGAGEVTSIMARAAPVLLVVDPAAPTPDLVGVDVVERADIGATWTGEPPGRWPDLAAHDPVAVVWTSGTTGKPKGALFDHANLAAVARGTDALSQPGDRRLSPLPFAHVGYMTRAWDEIANAVTTVITPTPWRADDAVRIMGAESVTVAQGVPTQYTLMLASPEFEHADLRSLRIASTGAARVPATLVAEVRRRFGVPVVVRYTSTEASLGTGTTLGSSDEEVATTVGRPVAGVELAIVDDDGRPVPVGSVGRVLLRSGATMRGYWGHGPGRGRRVDELIDAEATGAVLAADGWLTTGDFGKLTPAGNLQLSGRAHERYIRGGYNVYPAEVEETLSSHPSVARAAVVGVPDDVLGEIGVAVVVAAGDAEPELEELRAHCSRALSDYKAPDALVVVDELPLTPMMKVDPSGLAAVAARGADRRRSLLAQNRGSVSGVLGSGSSGETDEKERA